MWEIRVYITVRTSVEKEFRCRMGCAKGYRERGVVDEWATLVVDTIKEMNVCNGEKKNRIWLG